MLGEKLYLSTLTNLIRRLLNRTYQADSGYGPDDLEKMFDYAKILWDAAKKTGEEAVQKTKKDRWAGVVKKYAEIWAQDAIGPKVLPRSRLLVANRTLKEMRAVPNGLWDRERRANNQ